MTNQELRKLNRTQLLELLLEQSRENDRLREQLRQAEEQLSSRQIMLDEAGSIAEAALRVSGVFEAAQAAAEQYLDNVRALSGRQESVCARMEEDSRRKSEQLIADTEAKCRAMEAETEEKCRVMTREAQEKADAVWGETRQKLERFVDQQNGLRELLGMISGEAKRE